MHMSDWESKYEHMGPIKEEVFHGGHVCVNTPKSTEGYKRAGIPVPGGAIRLNWEVFGKIDYTSPDLRIVDMGGGPNPMPGAVSWSLENNHDMRDVRRILVNDPFDMLVSFHSIEHVYSHDVPEMLVHWIGLLKRGGYMVITAPHRCSPLWSALQPTSPHGWTHVWTPTCSCVGNFLIEKGMILEAHRAHCCEQNSWWIRLRKP